MDEPVDHVSEIPVAAVPVHPLLMRFYFVILFSIALILVYTLWRKVSSMDAGASSSSPERSVSLRGELLGQLLIFLNVYALTWLPVLFLGILDGELETSSVSMGMKGQVANAHCALQDLMVRSFCISIVVSTAIYVRYANCEESHNICLGRPNMFVWGMVIPFSLIEATRLLLSQKEWLMPTHSIINQIDSVKFSVESTPVFCVQKMGADWLRQVLAEWFITFALVTTSIFCCLPCFRYQKDSKTKGDPESDSMETNDSSTQEHMDLHMESLLDLDSPSQREARSSPQESVQSDSLKSSQSTKRINRLKSESKGLYARGAGFLESLACIGVFWAAIARPFMAISLYIMNTEVYSNHLDIPTHVLLAIAIALLPLEVDSKYKTEEEEEEEEEKNGKEALNKEQDEDPIWIIEWENGAVSEPKKEKPEDVDPIWIEKEDESGMTHASGNEETNTTAPDSPKRESSSK